MNTLKLEDIIINHHLPFPHAPGIHSVARRDKTGKLNISVSVELADHLKTLAAQVRGLDAS